MILCSDLLCFFPITKAQSPRARSLCYTWLLYCIPQARCMYAMLSLCSFLYCQLTAIVATTRAYGMIQIVSATVRADCQCGHLSHVMGTTFRLSGVRLSSFRMCHNYLTFYFVTYYLWAVGLWLNHFRVLPLRYIGGFGEVHPFEDCNHHRGDDARAEDL